MTFTAIQTARFKMKKIKLKYIVKADSKNFELFKSQVENLEFRPKK